MILIDLDGVLVDFTKGADKAHGKPLDWTQWSAGFKDPEDFWKPVNPEDFWKPINDAGERFWTDLPWYSWGRELYNQILDLDDEVYICTTPSLHPTSWSGKVKWMHRNFGSNFQDFIITYHKHLFARPGTILIDDKYNNIKKFLAYRGETVLFPQPWNPGRRLVPNLSDAKRIDLVIKNIKTLKGVL